MVVVEMRVHNKSHNMLGSPQGYHESTHSRAPNTPTVGLGQVQVVATHGNIGDKGHDHRNRMRVEWIFPFKST